jgi:hypothetical protein
MRPIPYTVLLALLTSQVAIAQDATLGRLFMTPAQRATLDRQRLHNPNQRQGQPEMEGSQTFNGEVRRSDGRNTRWINGETNWEKSPAKLHIPVGDTLHPGSGEHQSLIGNGQIIVKPSRP